MPKKTNITLDILIENFKSPTIPLDAICVNYFGLNEIQASKKASLQQLPVPAFRLGSNKSRWHIHAVELAAYIDSENEKAKNTHQKINAT